MSVPATHRRFRDVFRTRWAPARNTAFNFYRNSEEEVRMKKIDLSPSAVRFPENVVALQMPIGTQWLMQDGVTPYTAISCWIF